MCTAIQFRSKDRYFGRTLDYEASFGESVVITPRNWGRGPHYAMVGMAAVAEGIPLYYDAVNENGLCMAGLMFAGCAHYPAVEDGKENIAPHEVIPYVLGRCTDLRDVQVLLERLNIVYRDFNEQLGCAPLHWMIADRNRSAVLEATGELHFYENPAGVLTNAPAFPEQLASLNQYEGLSPLSEGLERGKGAVGLPGDWSSPSRFARAAFLRQHSRCGESEEESVSHFFRLMQAVSVPKGCVRLESGDAYTRYTCCCNQDQGIYYYSTYEDPRIMAVKLEPHGSELTVFPIK
ncbi:MAG: choloylglycine hydrolase family protein [Clostridia bacterium]|nr:choloylglycine hydrolase family protein [Clostridia bacterium]